MLIIYSLFLIFKYCSNLHKKKQLFENSNLNHQKLNEKNLMDDFDSYIGNTNKDYKMNSQNLNGIESIK